MYHLIDEALGRIRIGPPLDAELSWSWGSVTVVPAERVQAGDPFYPAITLLLYVRHRDAYPPHDTIRQVFSLSGVLPEYRDMRSTFDADRIALGLVRHLVWAYMVHEADEAITMHGGAGWSRKPFDPHEVGHVGMVPLPRFATNL